MSHRWASNGEGAEQVATHRKRPTGGPMSGCLRPRPLNGELSAAALESMREVSSSTEKQALNALVFFLRHVVGHTAIPALKLSRRRVEPRRPVDEPCS